MPSKLSLIALGVGAYIAFLIATFPAATALRWLALDGIELGPAAGTVWSGRVATATISGIVVTDLRWSLKALPLALLHADGSAEARLEGGFFSADFSASSKRVELNDLRLAIPVQSLKAVLPIYDTDGDLSASLGRLVLVDGWPVTAVGELRLGSLAVAPLIPTGDPGKILLGDFLAVFAEGAEPGVFAELSNTGGPVNLAGELALRIDRRYSLAGGISAGPDAPPELRQGIELMTGEPDSRGLRPFTLSGSL
jgi:hypothetical protein